MPGVSAPGLTRTGKVPGVVPLGFPATSQLLPDVTEAEAVKVAPAGVLNTEMLCGAGTLVSPCA